MAYPGDSDDLEVLAPGVLDAVEALPTPVIAEPAAADVAAAESERAAWLARRADLLERAKVELEVTAASAHGERLEPINGEDDLDDETADDSAADPEGRPGVVGRGDDESDTEATRKGKALHLVMELVDYANPGDLDAVVKHACKAEDAEGFEAEIREWVDNCLASDAVARAIAADEMHREVPFTIKVDEHFEVGRIDLLIREGATITVIDWKSDDITAGQEDAKAELAHAGQANAYARALRLTVPSLPVKEVIFVFARTGGQAVIQLEPDALF